MRVQVHFAYVALLGLRSAATPSQSPPHILFLLADDLGWGDVSLHNGGVGQLGTNTSRIDELCASGTRLDQYFTNPICTPSRASILTGRHVIRYGLQHGSISDNAARPSRGSSAAVAAGHRTWMLGKWHGWRVSGRRSPGRRRDLQSAQPHADVATITFTATTTRRWFRPSSTRLPSRA